MEAREKAGGGDVLTVEKRLLRQKEREEKKIKKRAEAEEARKTRENSLFSFINSSVLAGLKGGGGVARPSSSSKMTSRPGTSKGGGKVKEKKEEESMNMKSFRVGEEIRREEKEVQRLEASLARLRGRDPAAAAAAASKLERRRERLTALKDREGRIASAKSLEDGNRKLSIF